MNLRELVRVRRSVRAFTARPVEPGKLEAVLECIRAAPSAGNLQAFEVLVIRDANVQRQLVAAVTALEALKRPMRVRLYTDSEYLGRGITEWIEAWRSRGWRTAAKKPVKNRDLWQRLDDLRRKHDVTWLWVKGHAGDPLNERADALARAALRARGSDASGVK